jgi:hypothetical protein
MDFRETLEHKVSKSVRCSKNQRAGPKGEAPRWRRSGGGLCAQRLAVLSGMATAWAAVAINACDGAFAVLSNVRLKARIEAASPEGDFSFGTKAVWRVVQNAPQRCLQPRFV